MRVKEKCRNESQVMKGEIKNKLAGQRLSFLLPKLKEVLTQLQLNHQHNPGPLSALKA